MVETICPGCAHAPHYPHKCTAAVGAETCSCVRWATDATEAAQRLKVLAVKVDLRPEAVNHPAHYGGADNPYEAIKVIEAWGAGFNIGTALKYLCRVGKKAGETTIRDLEKARWYIDREIQNLKKRES